MLVGALGIILYQLQRGTTEFDTVDLWMGMLKEIILSGHILI